MVNWYKNIIIMSYLINPFLGVVEPTWEPEYQAVLDEADAQSIGTPSLAQNIINNAKVKNLKYEEAWGKLDWMYYFEQETGTPYEFLTLNWIDPTKYRLLNIGVNDIDFIGGSGYKYTLGQEQIMNTQYNPFTDAVNVSLTECSLIYSLFDCQTTYVDINRPMGTREFDVSNIFLSVTNEADNVLSVKMYGNDSNVAFTQSELNSHWHCNTNLDDDRNTYQNGDILGEFVKQFYAHLPNQPIYLFGANSDGAIYYGETTVGLKYVMHGGDLGYSDRVIYEIMTGTYYDKKVNDVGVEVLAIADITPSTVWWLQMYKSSDFPSITTVKDYFVTYSTDHDAGDGGIWWGECDDLELTNFVERGLIIDGDQSEAGFIYLKSNDIDGDIIHMTYHPNASHPDSGGYQQTRLITCTGGLLHTATWTDRGKPLGIVSPPTTENHTGYLIVETLGASSLVGIHATHASASPDPVLRVGKSTDTDGRAYTRISSALDTTSFMSYKRYYHNMGGKFFDRDSTQYLVAKNETFADVHLDTRLSLYECDGDYLIDSFIGNISIPSGGNEVRQACHYIEDDVLHTYYNLAAMDKIYHTTWNLSNLD